MSSITRTQDSIRGDIASDKSLLMSPRVILTDDEIHYKMQFSLFKREQASYVTYAKWIYPGWNDNDEFPPYDTWKHYDDEWKNTFTV